MLVFTSNSDFDFRVGAIRRTESTVALAEHQPGVPKVAPRICLVVLLDYEEHYRPDERGLGPNGGTWNLKRMAARSRIDENHLRSHTEKRLAGGEERKRVPDHGRSTSLYLGKK